MNNKQLVIEKPYIEIKDNRAYLKADIKERDKDYTLFFSVDIAYKDALCYEVADCFVVTVLQRAMKEEIDIISKAPVSRPLLYSLKTRLIPQLDKHIKRYHLIDIIAEPSDIKFDGYAVGTGWSGGVDCLYTFINNLNCEEKNHRLTHILNINAGVFEGNEKEIYENFNESTKKIKEVANRFELSAIDVDTNIHIIYDEIYYSSFIRRLCSSVLSLQKIFSIYYLSSSYDVVNLSYDEESEGYYEYIICSCLKTQNLRFIDFGCEVTRIEKIDQISNSPIAQEYLHVCVKEVDKNCMRCDKCIRTIGSLYALGKLEKFNKVFDINYVNNNIDSIIGYIIFNSRKGFHFTEILDMLNKNKIVISPKSYRYAMFLKTANKLAENNREIILKNTLQNINNDL